MMMRVVLACALALGLSAPVRAAVEVQEVTSQAGFEAWLVEEHSLPFVAIEIRFMGGQSLDAEGKRGAINLMTGLLEEGAADMDARAFAEARENLAARISFDSFDDAVSVSMRFLTENRTKTVALLKAALTEPRFDQDAIDRVRGQVLSNIRSDQTDPSAIARNAWAAAAWGEHPYGSDGQGTVESVTALTRDDIADAFQRSIARDRVFVGAVGDITADELAALLDELLSGLPEEGAPMPEEAEFLLEAGTTVIDFDTPQAVAIFGHEGIARDDPDFFAAFVVNEILGGSGFRSRLTNEVRVKRGLTYGIGAYLADKDHGQQLLGQVATVNDRMAETVQIVRDEWSRVAEEGVTAEELEAAKLYLTGAYPLRFDGNAPIAQIMVGMQMEGLPVDYIATRNDKVNAVTLEEANRVAAEVYRPDDLHFMLVGQPEGLDASN